MKKRCRLEMRLKQLLWVKRIFKNRKGGLWLCRWTNDFWKSEDLAWIVNWFWNERIRMSQAIFHSKQRIKQEKNTLLWPDNDVEAYLGEVSPAQILAVEPHTRKIIGGVNHTKSIYMKLCMIQNPEIKAVLLCSRTKFTVLGNSWIRYAEFNRRTQKSVTFQY